jgi:hypothetical protein
MLTPLTPVAIARIGAVLLLAFVAACGGDQWPKFEAQDQKFSIRMPGAPIAAAETVKLADGDVPLVTFSLRSGRGTFMLAHWDIANLSDRRIPQYYQRARGVVLAKGEFLAEKPARTGGVDGFEMRARAVDGTGYITARLLLAGTRMYILVATTPASASPDADKFFESFTLKI